MKALLPLLSAIGFLVAAGALLAWSPHWGPIGALVLVVVAVALLREHDREIATRAADEVLEVVNALGAAKGRMDGEWPR
ncbi:MAG: hypothetical protein ABSC22_05925 [Roseiarcus sp.]|jgi:Ca2+/H+ antiporter